ncbi:HU family DNA-binding protein [Amycolatopsis echigonensis]|uniref:DNA-binding protein HU-beta n=1 Tax=Amycolatopsis echigonensis TaxID=2576905 RepID=A0A2N3WBE8_9PSEU|nr:MULTISPECIES: HU family DNA-binding protein [Amycolatopsis]MBB2500905.1 HU family DNA-binding protein [Amycolatopsis echigonensis]PKV91196.1 DNA-binding protein HU-beta [Amycolatopsis niigatensis]
MANKAQLIEALSERLGDKKVASEAVDGLVDIIIRTVNKGEKVNITGFGVFEKRARAARTARNPRTGEAVRVKKTNVPAFRAGTTFKDVISGSKKLPKATAAKRATGTTARATSTRAASTTATRSTRATAAKPAATRTRATAAKAPAKATAAKTTTRATAAKSTTTRAKAAPKATTTRAKAAAKPAAKTTTAAKKTTAAAKRAPAKRTSAAKKK